MLVAVGALLMWGRSGSSGAAGALEAVGAEVVFEFSSGEGLCANVGRSGSVSVFVPSSLELTIFGKVDDACSGMTFFGGGGRVKLP